MLKGKPYAALAQLVEQRIRNAWVGCSSHPSGTTSLFVTKTPWFTPRCFFALLALVSNDPLETSVTRFLTFALAADRLPRSVTNLRLNLKISPPDLFFSFSAFVMRGSGVQVTQAAPPPYLLQKRRGLHHGVFLRC